MDWQKWLYRLGAGAFLLFLLFRVRYAANGIRNIPGEISDRTYRTGEEHAALFLLGFILFLLFSAILTAAFVLGALVRENRYVRFALLAAALFLFFLYACLYGYPLLDNHVTTAWLMTGRYTSTLILSLLRLLAGVFGKGFSWNESAAWHLVCGALLSCPFVLLATFVGIRNTLPLILCAFLPVFCFLAGEYLVLPGTVLMAAGAAVSLVSAGIMEFLTDPELMGRAAKEKKASALVHVEVDDKRRAVLLGALLALWFLTLVLGRVGSFGDMMRLVFSSSVYSYQKNLYDLGDMRIAQAMLLSYTLSLCVRFVLSKVEFADESDSRFKNLMNTGYMLLLQVWIMPVLSGLLGKAADHAQGALPGTAVKETAKNYAQAAGDFMIAIAGKSILLLAALYIVVLVLCLAAAVLLVRLPAVRHGVWFLVYFSACTFVYCLISLYFPKPLGSFALLGVCYVLNYMLNHLLSTGKMLREKASA